MAAVLRLVRRRRQQAARLAARHPVLEAPHRSWEGSHQALILTPMATTSNSRSRLADVASRQRETIQDPPTPESGARAKTKRRRGCLNTTSSSSELGRVGLRRRWRSRTVGPPRSSSTRPTRSHRGGKVATTACGSIHRGRLHTCRAAPTPRARRCSRPATRSSSTSRATRATPGSSCCSAPGSNGCRGGTAAGPSRPTRARSTPARWCLRPATRTWRSFQIGMVARASPGS
jgi:hypothetical protein